MIIIFWGITFSPLSLTWFWTLLGYRLNFYKLSDAKSEYFYAVSEGIKKLKNIEKNTN